MCWQFIWRSSEQTRNWVSRQPREHYSVVLKTSYGQLDHREKWQECYSIWKVLHFIWIAAKPNLIKKSSFSSKLLKAGHQWDSWERHNLGRALLLSLLWPEHYSHRWTLKRIVNITLGDEHLRVKWTSLLGMSIKMVRYITVQVGCSVLKEPNIPFGDWHTRMLALLFF